MTCSNNKYTTSQYKTAMILQTPPRQTALITLFLAFLSLPRNNAFAPSSYYVVSCTRLYPSSKSLVPPKSPFRLSGSANPDGNASSAPQTDIASSETADDGISMDATLLYGVEKMAQVMTPEFFASSSTLKQLYSQCLKPIEVRKSSIPGAGLGLFAKKNIKANTIVSLYPAHALGVEQSTSFVSLSSDESYFQAHSSQNSGYLHCTDQPIFKRTSLLSKAFSDVDDTTPLYLDVNPTKTTVDGWLSQMINDGAIVKENSEEGVSDYYRETKFTKNCIHIPFGPSPIMATVTTKKVKKGQELFTTYGCTYWLGALLGIHGEEAIGITNEIQEQIKETAMDLFKSMQVRTSNSLFYSRTCLDW